MAVRESSVRIPRADGLLVAVVELDVPEESSVEMRGAEVQIGDHVRFGDGARPLGPRAPPRGRHGLCEALLVDGRGWHEQRAQRLQAVALGVEAQAHVGGVAFGAERPCREPVAHRFERVPRQLHAGLSGLACVERDRKAATPAGEAHGGVAREPFRLRCPHRDHAGRVGRVSAVHECCERSISRENVGMRELEEAHTPHGGQIAVRKNGDRDGRLGRAGAAGSEQLCFDPHAGGPAAHDDGVAARRAAVSHRAIFQLREGERLVPHPRHDFGAADDGNG